MYGFWGFEKRSWNFDGNGEKFISEEQWRLLINPEFVESMDNSDGSEKFSPEDQAIENASTDY